MQHAPSDVDGLVIPAAVPSTAWSAVLGLRHVAGAVRDADRRLAVAASGSAWSGEAASAFGERQADLAVHLADLASVCDLAAEVIRAWAADAEAAVNGMRVARSRIEAARTADAIAAAAGSAWSAERSAASRQAWQAWHEAKSGYWRGVDETGHRLSELRDGLRGRPLDVGDQLFGFVEATAGSVGQQARGLWGLTGLALVDPDAWWENVSTLPGLMWDGLTDALDHPVDTAKQAVGLDLWEQGRYGEALGAAAMAGLPGGRKLDVLAPDEAVTRFASRLADPKAPPPRLQSVDEMLAGVDLEAHEHHRYGHALRRHVGAGDDYLVDRLRNGTLLDDGRRGFIPPSASTFPDLATANLVVTSVLQSRAPEVRAFAAGHDGSLRLTAALTEPLGKVMSRSPGGGFASVPGREAVVALARGPDGSVYVFTAFLR